MKKFLIIIVLMNTLYSQQKIYLNENWTFRKSGETRTYKATVPGCVHTDLLSNKLIDDPYYRDNEKKLQWIEKEDWEYSMDFILDKEERIYKNTELVFEGLDTYADVFLNGEKIIQADNSFTEWRVNVTELLRDTNNLTVQFRSPINFVMKEYNELGYKLPAGNDQSDIQVSIFTRKAPYHYGWDWGPRFVTSGIWRPVYLDIWNDVKIRSSQFVIKSIEDESAEVELNLEIESAKTLEAGLVIKNDNNEKYLVTNLFIENGKNFYKTDFKILNPKRWWPNGAGEQNLYSIIAEISREDVLLDRISKRIGLRTVEFISNNDSIGQNFYFRVNGYPVFMKGANYIPSDNFTTRVDKERYNHLIQSAKDANMNMLRVWGGGIYENDVFYDLCDENGILIFQDFMFACSMYPGSDSFLSRVKNEAEYNVKRLRDHPCIALWCGNNEMDEGWHNWGWKSSYSKTISDKIWNDYGKIFNEILPEAVNQHDPGRSYIPSTPLFGWANKKSITHGDMHYWGVWHAEEPFESYGEHIGRFVSEYGFQSFPEFNTVKKYTVSSDWHIRSDIMKIHQRHPRGNQLIETYMKMYYNVPKYFKDFLYIGQVLQAEGIRYAVEAYRRSMPHCMGSLYWQLDDCWPVASWSGIDYYGNWKALHYFMKKAYSQLLVSPVIENDTIKVYVISDSLKNKKSVLEVEVMDFAGNIIFKEVKEIEVKANSSALFFNKKIKEVIKNFSKKEILLSSKLFADSALLSANVLFFEKPKSLKLPSPNIIKTFKREGDKYLIELTCKTLAKNVYLQTDIYEGFFSDNYFDILPNEVITITFTGKNLPDNLNDWLEVKTLSDVEY